MARRSRQKASHHPVNLTSLDHLVIPSAYLKTHSDDNIFLWDFEYSTNLRRSFLLGAQDNLEHGLSSSMNLVIDGIFKVARKFLLSCWLCTGSWKTAGRRASTRENTSLIHQPPLAAGHLASLPMSWLITRRHSRTQSTACGPTKHWEAATSTTSNVCGGSYPSPTSFRSTESLDLTSGEASRWWGLFPSFL